MRMDLVLHLEDHLAVYRYVNSVPLAANHRPVDATTHVDRATVYKPTRFSHHSVYDLDNLGIAGLGIDLEAIVVLDVAHPKRKAISAVTRRALDSRIGN